MWSPRNAQNVFKKFPSFRFKDGWERKNCDRLKIGWDEAVVKIYVCITFLCVSIVYEIIKWAAKKRREKNNDD